MKIKLIQEVLTLLDKLPAITSDEVDIKSLIRVKLMELKRLLEEDEVWT